MDHVCSVIIKKCWHKFNSQIFSSVFSWRHFRLLGFTFRYKIHFNLVLYMMVGMDESFFNKIWCKYQPLICELSVHIFGKNQLTMYVGLFIDCVFHWSHLIIVCEYQALFNRNYAFLKYWVEFASEALCDFFYVGRFLTTYSNFLLQLQILFNKYRSIYLIYFFLSESW